MKPYHPDTICAVATPPGRGGVGIVRLSGPKSRDIALKILKFDPKVRHAHYAAFYVGGEVLDRGIAIYYAAPHSFTGEDIVELQGHGGPVVLDMLIAELVRLGARSARPGEFSERAFLNNKLDLAQAEAIADLIDASSQQAAKQALSTLEGSFSAKITDLVDKLTHLRIYVESAIDFPEEEIDFLGDGKVATMLSDIIALTEATQREAQQGVLLREGIKVVIAGRPNAGKSSLLNALTEKESAIVTDIAGTTRDVLREHIHIDGLPLHIIDTAGLRESPDQVEKIGIERAWQEIDSADCILLTIDSTQADQLAVQYHWQAFFQREDLSKKLCVIYNKVDISGYQISEKMQNTYEIRLSARTGEGVEALKTHLKNVVGYHTNIEGSFSARRRHLNALEDALTYLHSGQHQLVLNAAGELLAEDLQCAQNRLSEITGKFTADDLLGKIFSNFCIGK